MVDLELCKKLAWSFHKTTGMEYDDLFQEACRTWVEYVENSTKPTRFDPRKASLKTYATWCIVSCLKTLAAKQRRHGVTEELDETVESNAPSADDLLTWQDRKAALTDEAKMVLKIVMESPYDFLSLCSSRAAVRRAVEVVKERLDCRSS